MINEASQTRYRRRDSLRGWSTAGSPGRWELLGGLGGAQLVQVIDDQDERTAGLRELGHHLVRHRLTVGPGRRGRDSAPPVAARTAPSSASQNSFASCWSSCTDMKAIRQFWPGRGTHVCSRDVFPLPTAAEMTVTRFPAARSSAATRS